MTACAGLLGFVFTDFGEKHVIFDKNGEPLNHSLITSIDEDGMVTTDEKKRHNLEVGELVKFSEVVGLEGIND